MWARAPGGRLKHLLLVESERRSVQVWTRGDGARLVREVAEGEIDLLHVGVTLSVDALYAEAESLTA